MKKIYSLVLKAFVRPFIVTFFIVMFVLLMRFLFVYIDDFINKGLGVLIILQLLWYNSAVNVALALPLSILLSSIMTFGSLGENYELVAIKSAGISLQRAMLPLVVVVGLLSVGAFLFSDYILPVTNLKVQSLLYDVRNKKAAFLIKEGIFNNSVSGYSIRARKKGADGQTLHDVMIYEHDIAGGDNMNVLLAKEGKMVQSADKQYMVLKLKDGVRYQEEQGKSDGGMFHPRQRLTRFRFKETEQKFDLSEFKLQRTDESLFKANDIMLNLKQLRYYRDSVQVIMDSNLRSVYKVLTPYYKVSIEKSKSSSQPISLKGDLLKSFPEKDRLQAIQYAKDQIYSILAELNIKKNLNKDYASRLKGFIIEFHRKFTLSLSCLVLFFVGAPLGAIIRKGGLGLPVVVAVLCFLVFHVISTIGEKSVRDGSVSPILGMWIALITLAPIGAFFTYKAATDSVLFDADFYKRLFQKFSLKKEN